MAPVMSAVVSAMLSSMADTWTPLGTLPSGARAYALLLRNCAFGLRVLGLHIPAQLLHNSPFGRSLSSLRALAKSLPVSGPMLQTFRSAASARLKSPGRFEAARSAPDWRPIPSLRSVIPRPPVVRASRLTKHRISRVWERSFRCRSLGLAPACAVNRLSQRWGASFPLRRLGAAYHGFSGPWGPAQTFALGKRRVFAGASAVWDLSHLTRFGTCKTACPQADGLRALAHSNLNHRATSINHNSIFVQCTTKPRNKELMKNHAAH
jgi:hypothetical protein